MWIAIACLVVYAFVMTIMWFTGRKQSTGNTSQTPTEIIEKSQKTAEEIKNAPIDDLAARIELLRTRGRKGI